MSSHFAVLLAKNSASNPQGIPAEWYIDSRYSGPVLDPGLSALGYQLMTAEQFDRRQKDYGQVYRDWLIEQILARESVVVEEKNAEKASLTELQVIADSLKTAEKVDVAQLSSAVEAILNTLLLQRKAP